jgi:hypothetical protein
MPGSLQQPGEPLTNPHLVHLVWSGLQHESLPLICPQPVQIAAVSASLGILQQPGEPLARLQPEHLGRPGLQHSSPPFICPQCVQRATLSAAAVLVFLQPEMLNNPMTNDTAATTNNHSFLVFIVASCS